MKTIITCFLILATSLVAQARIIPHWSDQELLEKSDLVVLATPTATADTQERTDLPGFLAQHVIGIETGFAVSAVVKGDKTMKNFVLHHYRADEERAGLVVNGPNLIAFKPEEKRKFLLFLIREADGRYAPTVGQVDPGFQGIAALGNPMSTTPSSPPLVDVVKATSPTSRALDEKYILAAGDWSEPVAGSRDKNTTRGAHQPTIRGRLLLCESSKNHQTAAYLELQDCCDTWGGSTEIYCDMGGFLLELRDANGQLLPIKEGGGGGMPGAHWMTLPCDSTVRLRISAYASFSFASQADYFMSGSFVVDPPADHTGLDVWQGTLKLPAMKVVVPRTIPDVAQVSPAATAAKLPLSPEAQTVLDGLNQKAAEEPFILASLNSLLPKITSGMTHEGMKKVLEGAYPNLAQQDGPWSGAGGYIGFKLDDRYSVMFSARMNASQQSVVSSNAQISVFDRLQKWRLDITRHSWENAPDDKAPTKVADQIGTLVERLSKSHTWTNGAHPKLDTPKDASAKDVIAAYCKMSSFQDGSRISEFTVLEERTVKISGPLPDAYIAARCKTDHGPMIFLLQYQEKPGQWWVKQYDAPAEQDAAGQPATLQMFAHIGEWTPSPDKTLSIRISSDKAGYQLGETVKLGIELRNDSTQPAELSSLEDESYPWIEDPGQKRNGYIGPEVSRPPKPRVTLEPGMSVTREVAVEGENWGKLETPGKHTATFSYGRPQSGAYKGLTSTLTFDVK